jgi:hypothetical protein
LQSVSDVLLIQALTLKSSRMPSSLPAPSQCCNTACDATDQVEVPGPAGDDGAAGANGTNGANAYTTFTADFTIPAELGSDTATVADSSWMAVNQIIYAAKTDGSVVGYFQVTAIGGATSVTLKNLEDAATSAYAPNSAPGAILTSGSKISPAGLQGPTLASSGAAGGSLKGTYPNPTLLLGNTKGSILAGNGTDTVAVAAGTNGHMLAYDSTDAEGIKAFAALPLTGGTDVLDNRVARLDGTTGLPIPMQSSRVSITDDGAIRADGSTLGSVGDARGTEAVDLQVRRSASTMVASGTSSTIAGGKNNTASGAVSAVGGGDGNAATADGTTIGGGQSNQASTAGATVAGGDTNIASGDHSTVGGGDTNTASNFFSTVAGGEVNVASGVESTVGGGSDNIASGAGSTIAGGLLNTAAGGGGVLGGSVNHATGTHSSILGGTVNTSSGQNSAILGGQNGTVDKYGQIGHASGRFAADGDAQVSELVMRINTTNATPAELFLNGSTLRCTIPTGKSWMFEISLVARTDAGLDAIYTSIGVIRNNAGTTTLSGTTTTEVFDGASLPATPVVVTADDANDALVITVTGIAATNIRWVARVRLVEVAY